MLYDVWDTVKNVLSILGITGGLLFLWFLYVLISNGVVQL